MEYKYYKFRIYDLIKHQMIDADQMHVEGWHIDDLGDVEGVSVTMQYLNLKDKEGEEIYDGDILTIDGTLLIVKYYDFLRNYDEVELKRVLVAGNIYETPELVGLCVNASKLFKP